MSEPSTAVPATPGLGFTIAIWFFGLLAVGQALWIGWILMGKSGAENDLPAGPGRTYIVAPPAPAGGETSPARGPDRDAKGVPLPLTPVQPISPPRLPDLPVPEDTAELEARENAIIALAQDRSIPVVEDREAIKFLALAEELEEAQDIPGALRNLRQADRLVPRHPSILYRLANAYEKIGNVNRAGEYYQQVYQFGPGRAGELAVLAGVKLKGEAVDRQAMPRPNLTIAEVLETRHEEVTSGEKVSLLIRIKSESGEEISPENVRIYVFFFDVVNGRRIEQTTADEPVFEWKSEPVNWVKVSEELLQVTYYHPELTLSQRAELGTRAYFGYVVKLYYFDEIQDLAAR
ncbi:MAG: hypothetical protein AAF514_18805, partial [Verrucomicrobiota bacterium]